VLRTQVSWQSSFLPVRSVGGRKHQQEKYMYNSFKYLYPPRPENALTPDRISYYEKHGFVGQYKKNGTCSIFAINHPNDFIAMTRHNDNHKQWVFSQYFHGCFAKYLPANKWHVFVGEVLHSKTVNIKDTVYIFDILVYNSEELYGSKFMDRQNLLKEIFQADHKQQMYSHYEIEPRFLLARNFESGMYDMFKNIEDKTVDEGFVLKKKDAILKDCYSASNNSSWQIKFRHPSKKYQF
jgi:hypothetical protein